MNSAARQCFCRCGVAAEGAWRAGTSSPHRGVWFCRSDIGCALAVGSEQRDPIAEVPEAPLAQDRVKGGTPAEPQRAAERRVRVAAPPGRAQRCTPPLAAAGRAEPSAVPSRRAQVAVAPERGQGPSRAPAAARRAAHSAPPEAERQRSEAPSSRPSLDPRLAGCWSLLRWPVPSLPLRSWRSANCPLKRAAH